MFPWPIQGFVISPEIRRSIASHVAADHPREAGGFLGCVRRGNRLYSTHHVPLSNESSTPKRRFETTVDDRVPPPPRVFYHSHTSASSPSGLTRVDKRSIPEPFALVVFAPHQTVLSYRGFKHRLLGWHEIRIETSTDRTRLARL
jgi:proteasome lid subunit RPN8/RPN11